MTQNSQTDQIKMIISGALDCAEKTAWQHVTLSDIADASGLECDLVKSLATRKATILQWVWDDLDRQVMAEYIDLADEDAENQEKLFEAMMCRFDLMQERRAAYLSLYHAAVKDPVFIKRFATDAQDSMIKMVQFLKIDIAIMGTYHGSAIALSSLYLYVLHVWSKDESADMAQTMAALDKRLGQLGGLYHKICDFFGGRVDHPKEDVTEAMSAD